MPRRLLILVPIDSEQERIISVGCSQNQDLEGLTNKLQN